MKKILFSLMVFTFATAAFAQKKVAEVAKFNTETFNFGKIKQNVPATATFIVTNVGTEPLIIETATPTCGCTASDYTKSPIAPGKTGYIKAVFNAAAPGAISKAVTIKFAGVDEVKPINLAGEVLDAKAYEAWAAGNKSSAAEKTTVKVKEDKVKTETKTANGTTKSKTKKSKKADKSVVKK